MKVKNEYVQIQIGNKIYTKRNMILNTYLNKIFQSQINPSFNLNADITNCYLKLDTPLENIDYDSELSGSNFDVVLQDATYLSLPYAEKLFKNNSIRTNNNILMTYKFTSDGYFQYYTPNGWQNGEKNEFDMFNGRKITNIGFGNSGVYAVVDVSDLNIMINSNEKVIITRADLYQSDAICKGFDYPLHLVNFTAKHNAKDVDGVQSCVVAELYSIGLGNTIGLMEGAGSIEKEFIIDFDSSDVQIGDRNIEINFRQYIVEGIYPSENLFPSYYLKPKADTSKYVILKYRLLEIDDVYNTKTYLDEYYTMSYRNDFSNYINPGGGAVIPRNITLNLSIERL